MAGARKAEYCSSANGLRKGPARPYFMRKRLLVSVAFAAVGLAAALPVGDQLGLPAPISLIGFGSGGLFIGYALSMFLDVFLANSNDNTTPES